MNTQHIADQIEAIVTRGWVLGHPDGAPGIRIYPSWSGALQGKRLALRDVRMLADASFIVWNPWKNEVVDSFASLDQVEAHILATGAPVPEGANVWD